MSRFKFGGQRGQTWLEYLVRRFLPIYAPIFYRLTVGTLNASRTTRSFELKILFWLWCTSNSFNSDSVEIDLCNASFNAYGSKNLTAARSAARWRLLIPHIMRSSCSVQKRSIIQASNSILTGQNSFTIQGVLFFVTWDLPLPQEYVILSRYIQFLFSSCACVCFSLK